jgi:hypothetical protein
MTTFEKKFKELLFNHGLWEDECDAIFEEFRKSPVAVAMTEGDRDRFHDDMEDYGPNANLLFNIHWLGLKKAALEWLGKNKPLHWARAMFSDDPDTILAEQKKLWDERKEKKEGEEAPQDSSFVPKPPKYSSSIADLKRPNMQQLPREKKP